MIFIATRLERRRNNSAAGASRFGRRDARFNLKLSNGIWVWMIAICPNCDFVVIDTIKREIIVGRTRTIDH